MAGIPNEFVIISHNVLAFAGYSPLADDNKVNNTDLLIAKQASELYQKYNPDVVCLQEAPEEPYLKELAKRLNYTCKHFVSGWFGSLKFPYGFPGGLLSKNTAQSTFDFNLSKNFSFTPPMFDRHLAHCQWLLPNGDTLHIIQTHLCPDYNANNNNSVRLQELDFIINHINKLPITNPILLVGDLNFEPLSEPYNKINSSGFTDAAASDGSLYTAPANNPALKLDYIFTRLPQGYQTSFEVLPMPIPKHKPSTYLSDHYPIMLKLSW